MAVLALEFAAAVREGRDVWPDGMEGLADIRVLEAIVEAARSGRKVGPRETKFAGRRLDYARARKVPGHGQPKLVKA